MIVIKQAQSSDGKYYDFTLVKGDTGQFVATPKVNGEPYVLLEGDSMDFKVSKKPNSEALLTVVADNENRFVVNAEASETLAVGDYYCDITLNYANGNKDTFIKIPTSKGAAISNFHVTYGV